MPGKTSAYAHINLLFAAACYALLIAASRLLNLLASDASVTGDHLLGLLLSLPMESVIGLLLAACYYYLPKAISLLIIASVLLLKISSFMYEAEFGRLAGKEVFFYASELRTLSASVSDMQYLQLGLMTISCLLMLVFLFNRCRIPRLEFDGLIIGVLVITALIIQTQSSIIPGGQLNSSRESVTWPMVESLLNINSNIKSRQAGAVFSLSSAKRFLEYHGFDAEVHDPQYPACQAPRDTTVRHRRDVVIILMEGIGKQDMMATIAGKPVMPNLQRIAKNNIDYPRFVSSGSKSIHAMTAIFSGLPGNPTQHLLWNQPLLNLQSFVSDLRLQGYDTTYIQGADLSFENQRQYLKSIQFKNIIEYDPALPYPVYGWGYDDKVTFEQLKQTLIKDRANFTPAFITLATLSTHHPYSLPPDYAPVFLKPEQRNSSPLVLDSVDMTQKDEVQNLQRAEAQHFTDEQLGHFYDWFRGHYPDGVLLITSDHPPHKRQVKSPEQLGLPMLISADFTAKQLARFNASPQGIATHYDIPATIAGLLDTNPPSCSLGFDFLAEAGLPQRYVYAPFGNGLERLFVWDGDESMVMNWLGKTLSLYSGDKVINLAANAVPKSLQTLFTTLITTHRFLQSENRYAPPGREWRKSKPIDPNRETLVVSHRGNLSGPNSQQENSEAALDSIADSSFKWVEIDTQITSDDVLVLHHDDDIRIGDQHFLINDLTYAQLQRLSNPPPTLDSVLKRYGSKLNFLIEAKTPHRIDLELAFSRQLTRVIKANGVEDRVIIDSFDRFIADSTKQHCNCEVGFDTAYQEPLATNDFIGIAESNLDWVYVNESIYDQTLLANAHAAGVKVMVYTVNDPEQIKLWQEYLPDGIITDYTSIAAMIKQ